MSRTLKKCWVCDKCGEVRVDVYSDFYRKQLPPGWMFMNTRSFSNSCICRECRNDIVKQAERSKE